MTFSKIDTGLYYTSMAAMIIVSSVQVLLDLFVLQEIWFDISLNSDLSLYSDFFFMYTLVIMIISALLLYIQMLRVDIDSDFATRLRRYGKFALVTLGASIGIFQITFSVETSFSTSILIILLIIGLLTVHTIGSVLFIPFLSANTDREKHIQKGLISYVAGLLFSGLLIFEIIMPFPGPGGLNFSRILALIMTAGGLIYSNYSLKAYRLDTAESSDEDIELYISAYQQS